MDNVEKAITEALDQHAAASRHIMKWTDALAASIQAGIVEHLAEKMFVSESMRVRAATLGTELANDFVDDFLPRFIHDKTKATHMDGTLYAEVLNQSLLSRIAKRYVEVAARTLDPQIKKNVEKRDEFFRSQPSNKEVVPQIDLGAYAADQNKRFAIEDARAAAPAPASGGYVDSDADPVGVLAAGEAAMANSRYPAKRQKGRR